MDFPFYSFLAFFLCCTCEGAMTASLCTALMPGPQPRTLRQQGSFTRVTNAWTWTSGSLDPLTWAGLVKNGWQGLKSECIPGRKAHKRATWGTRTRAFLWSSLRHPEHRSQCSSGLRQVISLDFRRCIHPGMLCFHHPVPCTQLLHPFPPAAPEHS